ncbi:hypothetical protein LCGC14_0960670 [marine sediment metagenome]|uniref:Uncharacterized protein n=1 Tax=marine sediment metagenome TaxID=412755 RepID=A0A0F9NJB7_9ZZZZ
MKIKIYNEKKEKEYALKLFLSNDRIVLALADEEGNKISSSSLISIKSDMTLVRCRNINSTLGLPLTDDNQLKLEGE